MALKLVTPPTAFPVTLEEARDHCKTEPGQDDNRLSALIAAATDYVEQWTCRAIMTQTWDLFLDAFADTIMFTKGPVQSVASVKYIDAEEVEQTISNANWALDNVSDPAWLVRASSFSWPTVAEGINNVTIRYVAGYETVPPAIKHAILLLVSFWFDMRSAASTTTLAEPPHSVAALLVNYRSYAG